MRVDWLHLPDFRNLRDFTIDFDQESPRTVLIGRNGVGKTNILEALTTIFGQLDLRDKPTFAYRIGYSCNGYRVEVGAERPSAEAKGSRGPFTMTFRVARSLTASAIPRRPRKRRKSSWLCCLRSRLSFSSTTCRHRLAGNR
jgi:DNA repair exonuclease SbcCD ATPase subunit